MSDQYDRHKADAARVYNPYGRPALPPPARRGGRRNRGWTDVDSLTDAISRMAGDTARRRGGMGGAWRRTVAAVGEEGQRSLVRTVSMMGVDPNSPEGQQIIDMLASGMPSNSPDVLALVGDYQDSLIGPLSERTRSPQVGDPSSPTNNQYGYRKGDEFTQLDGLSAEMLARTQERLAALGILDGHIRGRVDQRTVEAFSSLLWMSNTEGTSWKQTLLDLERQKEEMGDDWSWGKDGDDRDEFVAPSYLAPDYATLAQEAKGMIRERLGREPDESELALFTAEMSGWHRDAFDAEAAALRAEWEAGEDGRDESPTVQTVDHLARFRESFEQRFAGELRGIQRTAEATETNETVRGAVSTLSQMSGGMG